MAGDSYTIFRNQETNTGERECELADAKRAAEEDGRARVDSQADARERRCRSTRNHAPTAALGMDGAPGPFVYK
jgi:hypothetical protein